MKQELELSTLEIHDEMTRGNWIENKYSSDWGVYSDSGDGRDIAIVRDKGEIEGAANTQAICNAVNGTYLKGYDPLAMEELVKRLQECQRWLQKIIDVIPSGELEEILIAGNIATLDTLNKAIIK